jgi:hypothetical protein
VTSLVSQAPGAQTVIDPLTGVAVPVVPVTEGVISQPVLQPLPSQPEPTPEP